MTRAILSFSLFCFYTYKSTRPHASVFFCRKACWKQALRNKTMPNLPYIAYAPKLVTSNKVTSFRKNDNLIMALFL